MDMDENNTVGVQEQADRWFARLLAPDCSARERETFEQWRRVPEHASAYGQRERLWRRFAEPEVAGDPRLAALRERVLARTAAGGAAGASDWQQTLAALPPRARPERIVRKRRAWPLAIAASICALAIALGVRFMGTGPAEAMYVSMGALREVALEDGTRVQLDVGTELAVRFDGDARAVTLRRGRALFDVAHDAQRPFTVDLGDSQVTVLGTRFQILRSPDDVSVTLDRGSLRLDGGTGAVARSERLVPGDQVGYSRQDPSTWHKRRVDSAAETAWSRGRLVFRATPLAEAVREVNRYANPKLHLADPSLSDLRVSGNFIAGDGDLVASTWAATLPLRVEKRSDEIVLRSIRK